MMSVSALFTNVFNYFAAQLPAALAAVGSTAPLTKNWRAGWWNLLGNDSFPCGFLMVHAGKPDEVSVYAMQDHVAASIYWVVKDKNPNLAALLVVDAFKEMVMADMHLGGACVLAEISDWAIGTDEQLSSVAVLKLDMEILIQ